MKSNEFNYTYSPSEQNEIEKIRKKYEADTKVPEKSKLERLVELDKRVNGTAAAAALSVGIFFTLLMGCGMSLVMTDIGKSLDISFYFPLGIVLGLVGIAGVVLAYPLYQAVLKAMRKKYAPQIIALCDELTNSK